MSSIGDRYHKIEQTILKVFGLWPYQNSKWARIQAIFMTSLYLSAIFVQLAVFITHECTLDLLINVLSFIFPTIFMLLMYDMYYFNIDVFKKIVEHIRDDWKSFDSDAELAIMCDYASISKQFSNVFLFSICVLIFATIITHAIPMTLDVILPLNESRAQDLHITVEYFVDPYKYYFFLVLHLTIFISLGTITAVCVGIMLLSYGLHACALFKIANYRMEIMMDRNILHIPSPEKEHIIYEKIIYAVDVHRRAMQYCELFVSSLDKSLFFMLITGVISLSINLFRFLTAITAFKEIIDVFIPSALIFLHFSILFLGNHIGQEVTNHNADIFNTVYNLPWYLAPLHIQKLLLFLLLKGNKKFYLSLQGFVDTSYESFTALTTSSISYFAVIYSLQ